MARPHRRSKKAEETKKVKRDFKKVLLELIPVYEKRERKRIWLEKQEQEELLYQQRLEREAIARDAELSRKIKALDKQFEKHTTFDGPFLLITFIITGGQKFVYIFEKDLSINPEVYENIFAQYMLPEGTSYTKSKNVYIYNSFDELVSCISCIYEENSKYLKSSQKALLNSFYIDIDDTQVQYFTLNDMEKTVNEHKQNYFGIVYMLQQQLFKHIKKHVDSLQQNITFSPSTVSPFSTDEKTTSDLNINLDNDNDYHEYDDEEEYERCKCKCKSKNVHYSEVCKSCLGDNGAFNKFPVRWLSTYECNCNYTYQLLFELAYDRNSGITGIIFTNKRDYSWIRKTNFYDVSSPDFNIMIFLEYNIYTTKICSNCSLREKIAAKAKQFESICSNAKIFIFPELIIHHKIRFNRINKFEIPIEYPYDIEVSENKIYIPCLESLDFEKASRNPTLQYLLTTTFSNTLNLCLNRFSVHLPPEILEYILTFITIPTPSYSYHKKYIIPFTGDINSENMIRQLSYVPQLLLCNPQTAASLGIEGLIIYNDSKYDDDYYYDDD